MVLNLIKNGFDILKGYSSITGSDGNLEDPNQLADREFFTNNQVTIQDTIKENSTNTDNLNKQIETYTWLKNKNYTKLDSLIRADLETASGSTITPVVKNGSSLVLIDGKPYVRIKQVGSGNGEFPEHQEEQDKGSRFSDIANMTGMNSKEAEDFVNMNKKITDSKAIFSEKGYIKSIDPKDGNWKPGTLQITDENGKTFTEYFFGRDTEALLPAEFALRAANYLPNVTQEALAYIQLADYQEKTIAEKDSILSNLKEEIKNQKNNGSNYRVGAGAGMTISGKPIYFLTAELDKFLIGLNATNETYNTEKLQTREDNPVQITPGRTVHSREESEQRNYDSKAFDLMIGYRLSNEISAFLTAGHKEKTTELVKTSEKWQEIDGEKLGYVKEPTKVTNQNKLNIARFGGGILVNPTDYLALKLVANFANFETPEYSAGISVNVGTLEKNIPEMNMEEIINALQNATSTINPSLGAVYTQEGAGIVAGISAYDIKANAMHVLGNNKFTGVSLGYQLGRDVSLSALVGESQINGEKRLQLGAEVESKINNYSSILAGIKGDKKNKGAYVGAKILF
ncbi:hypothetical protein K9L67_00405 [Candidatus Woesearchaeota archaeon]|nr:hypothetical protein [Candidatus Woesearchaeota archaeon]MCF7900667.1 hypothetical protein [Candidatus Woesearchaeota archaeon]MCF8013498.1 hypothetical protein [Candidatus Woesearchaeota archaeon]